MKRKEFLQKSLLMVIAPAIGSIGAKLYAKTEDGDDIPIHGDWPNGGEANNAQTPSCGVVVTLSGSTLYITGAACGSPVAVLINGSSFIYHDVFADTDANNIMIDLSTAPSGVYTLHISNLFGGYLDGTFNL
jgi:hypothetical protein